MIPVTASGRLRWNSTGVAGRAAAVAKQWSHEAAVTTGHILEARRIAARPDTSTLTRARLTTVADALEHNLDVTRALLAPVLSAAPPVGIALEQGTAGNRAPLPLRDLAWSYLFRDWVWETDEYAAVHTRVMAALDQLPPAREALVIGGGAMRLPWEIALRYPRMRVSAIDRNPVLCLAVDRLLDGGHLDAWEIPPVPRDPASVAIRHRVMLPPTPAASAPLHLVLGDAWEWAPETPVDWLVTPFVLDAAGGDAMALVERWSAWLRPGGWWINVGPLAFHRPWRAEAYTHAEVLRALSSEGWRVAADEAFHVPHLASPHDARTGGFHVTMTVMQRKGASV